MTPPVLRVGHAELVLLAHPLYAEAHPGEPCHPGERCSRCAWARRQDTDEVVLLWLAGGTDWTVSRVDPQWARHRADFATASGRATPSTDGGAET